MRPARRPRRVWALWVAAALLAAQTAVGIPGRPAITLAASCGAMGGTLQIGNVRAPVGLDPNINYGITSDELQGAVYDGLVRYAPDGTLSPALATAWTQPTPTTYVFTLRRNVQFGDGTPFSASDVVFTFQRIEDPRVRATRGQDLLNILDRVDARGPYTVEVRLKRPQVSFLNLLASPDMYIVSASWAVGHDFTQAMNGTGPFRLTSYEPNVRYTLERNPHAWAPPCLDRVEILPIPDDRARAAALLSGQVNFVDSLPWQAVEQIMRQRGYRVYRGHDIFNFVRLNPTRPPLDNPQVRQALNFAIDRQALSFVAFDGLALPMTGFLTAPGSWAYSPTTSRVWTYDPNRALALLRAAGYARPQDVHLVFESWSGSLHLDIAQAIATQLTQLGISVDLRPIEAPALYQKRVTGDYMMLMDGLGLPWNDPDAYYDFFHSGASGYAAGAHFRDPQLDVLLEQGRATSDRARRQAIYVQVERRLFEDAPWLFAVWRPEAEAAGSSVQGFVRMPDGLGPYSLTELGRIWIAK